MQLEHKIAITLSAYSIGLIVAFTQLIDSMLHFFVAGLLPGTNVELPWTFMFGLSTFVGYFVLLRLIESSYHAYRLAHAKTAVLPARRLETA